MKRRIIASSGSIGHINVTPMIDVVMCLIVFYLIVGRLASRQLTPMELAPSAVGIEEQRPEVLVVNVAPAQGGDDGTGGMARILVDGRELADVAALEALVRGRLLEKPETAVQVRGGRRLAYAAIEPVLRACAGAGANGVELVAERVGGAPPTPGGGGER